MAASLLGTFTPVTSFGDVTSGSRTTTAGSLICVHGSTWLGSPGAPFAAATDNQSNSYTQQQKLELAAYIQIALSFNHAGTRGASHTVTQPCGSYSAVGGSEWDGIKTAPTILNTTASTLSSAVATIALSPSVPSLLVGDMSYNAGVPTTFAVTAPTLAVQEIDEDGAGAAAPQCVGYKASAIGATSLDWTLANSSDWAAIAVAFEEVAAVSAALTGTATASITEADIVAGGKTLVITVTGDTFIAN